MTVARPHELDRVAHGRHDRCRREDQIIVRADLDLVVGCGGETGQQGQRIDGVHDGKK